MKKKMLIAVALLMTLSTVATFAPQSSDAHHMWGSVECYNVPNWQDCEASTTSGGFFPIEYLWWIEQTG